jgi:hypothetical protein
MRWNESKLSARPDHLPSTFMDKAMVEEAEQDQIG